MSLLSVGSRKGSPSVFLDQRVKLTNYCNPIPLCLIGKGVDSMDDGIPSLSVQEPVLESNSDR